MTNTNVSDDSNTPTHTDVGRVGHSHRSQSLVLALSVDDAGVEEELQVRHQDTQVKGVVHAPSVDGKLVQPVDKVPGHVLSCKRT